MSRIPRTILLCKNLTPRILGSNFQKKLSPSCVHLLIWPLKVLMQGYFNILIFSPQNPWCNDSGLSVYPETETDTRVTVLPVTDWFLVTTRFWPRIVLLPKAMIPYLCQVSKPRPWRSGQVVRYTSHRVMSCHRFLSPWTWWECPPTPLT